MWYACLYAFPLISGLFLNQQGSPSRYRGSWTTSIKHYSIQQSSKTSSFLGMDGVQLCKYAQWFLLSVNLRIVSTLFKTNEHLSTIILALLLFPFVLLCANNIFIFIGCKRQLFISDGGRRLTLTTEQIVGKLKSALSHQRSISCKDTQETGN